MAEVLNLQVALKLLGTLENAIDLSTPVQTIASDFTLTYGNGTGANQANMFWHDQRTTDTTGESLDLAGGLTSAFGTTITFTAVKGILIQNTSGSAGSAQISRPANGLVLFAAQSDQLANLTPGSVFLFTDVSAAGLAVTGGTGDLLKIAASASTITYNVVIWGEV